MSETVSQIELASCHPFVDGLETSYGPDGLTLAPTIVFVTLFSISLISHCAQAFRARWWWNLVFVVGAFTEVVGWVGRLWGAKCPYQSSAFLMQICCLIIAPTFFTAGIYIVLGRLIQCFGPWSSPLAPKTYLWIFCSIDFVSLVLQAIGGGMASGGSDGIPKHHGSPGADTMLAGIVFQLASLLVFSGLLGVFLLRVREAKALPRTKAGRRAFKALVGATILSDVCIIVRGCYRTAELSQGWNGYLIHHESYFNGFDGSLMVIAVAIFNFFHPAWLLPHMQEASEHSSELDTADKVDVVDTVDLGLLTPTKNA